MSLAGSPVAGPNVVPTLRGAKPPTLWEEQSARRVGTGETRAGRLRRRILERAKPTDPAYFNTKHFLNFPPRNCLETRPQTLLT